MKSPWLSLLTAVSLPLGITRLVAGDVAAYYTHIQSSEAFERYSRTGDDADIVVQLAAPAGRLVFWRGSSYRPYWETASGRWDLEEILPRHGDGDRRQPDRVNVYSHVAIVENTPQRVLVSWRYLPQFEPGNPSGGLDPTRFAEESFSITPDGRVTRVIKQGTARIDDWNDPLNQTTQVLQLAADGVKEISRRVPAHSPPAGPVAGNPLRGEAVIAPVGEWRFDDAVGDAAVESVTGTRCPIAGPKALWKKGVSGTALEFDGYNTVVALPAAKSPAVAGGSLTLEAWFALGAYPWNWAPIVQQGDNDGYFLGVDSHGYPGFMVKVDGVWEQLCVPNQPPYADTNHLALFRWYHLAGAYNQGDGMMRLFLDGTEIASKRIGKGGMETVNTELRIGKAGIMRVPTEGTHDTLPSNFGLDGLIDEVRVYNVALSQSQVAGSFARFNPGPSITSAPDMQKRSFPVPPASGKFGAVYTHLPYYETWDNLFRFGAYPDVVVGFDRLPTKFVFWHGVSFIPMMVNEANQWFTEEFNETGDTAEAPGDCEPMSDKACYDSHIRIIESNAARVVVEWRYRLANPDHHWANYDPATGWGDIADWHFTIYPDGVASVLMRLYTAKSGAWYEWDEQIAVFGEGQHPETIVRKTPVMTLVDHAGKASDYNWNPNPPKPNYAGTIIQMIHFTGRYSPFAIQDFTGGDIYSGERTWYSVFPTWNHWPTAQADSSGRNASFPDRAAHSSISHLFWPMYAKQEGDVPFQAKILMEGMTDRPAASLTNLAGFWLHAPALEGATDCRSAGYDPAQRAYVVAATGPAPSFRLGASADQPVVNPCFVVRDWNADTVAQVEVNGVAQREGPAVRQGITRDPNGRRMLVVWLQRGDTTPVTITLRGAKPAVAAALPPLTWAAAPQPVTNAFAVTMMATAVSGVGNAYFFECAAGPGHGSGWQSGPRYTDAGLPPATELAYRVKARNAYLAETAWSPVEKVRTPAAPPPVVWNLDEGSGTRIGDSTGKHDGVIHGTVAWVAGVHGKALHLDGQAYVEISRAGGLHSDRGFTWAAWIRTTQGGTILARAGAGREWQPGGKALFVENGRLRFDVGWVGATGAETRVNDGRWHHVAVTVESAGTGDNVRCYVDGRLDGDGSLDVTGNDEARLPVKIGFCNEDFPRGQSAFVGDLDDLRWYACALSPAQVRELGRR